MASETMRLPIIHAPEVHESFYGYILRLTNSCYYPSINLIMKNAGFITGGKQYRPSMIFNAQIELEKLSTMAGCHVRTLNQMLHPPVPRKRGLNYFGEYIISKRCFNTGYDKICPKCLIEKPFIRSYWLLKPVSCCVDHKLLLLDICPSCMKRIAWNRLCVWRCKCGHDLRMVQSVEVEEIECVLTSYILKKLGIENAPNSIDHTPFGKLDVRELLRLYFIFGSQYSSDYVRADGDFFFRNESNSQLHDYFNKVTNIFLNWPESFKEFFEIIKKHESLNPVKAITGFRRDCGHFFDSINLKMRDKSIDFVRQELKRYLGYDWEGGYIRNIRKLEFNEAEQAYMSFAETCSYLKVSDKWLQNLIDKGLLEAKVIGRARANFVTIKKESVKALKVELESYFNFYEVAEVLGLSRGNFRMLINARLITPVRGPIIDGYPRWLFKNAAIENFLAEVWAKVVRIDANAFERKTIGFRSLRILSFNKKNRIGEVIRRIYSGEITGYYSRRLSSLHGIKFDLEEIKSLNKKILKEHREGGYSFKEAGMLLGTKLSVISHFVKHGFLNAEPLGIRDFPNISHSCIDNFKMRHVFLSELSKELKTSPKNLLRILRKIGILPVSGPSLDGGRQYIYLKQDLTGIKLWDKVHKKQKNPRRLGCYQAAKYLGISMQALQRAVKCHKIGVQGSPNDSRTKYGHLKFSKFELDRYKRRCIEESGILTAREAANALNEDLSWFYKKWVKSRRLSPVRFDDALGIYFFRKSDVLNLVALKRKTVTGPEAAKIIGVTRNTIFKWNKKGEIIPVSGPKVDGFGCHLYLRKDVVQIKKKFGKYSAAKMVS